MNKYSLLILSGIVLLASHTLLAQSPASRADLSKEDIAVFQTVLATNLPNEKQPVIVEQETVSTRNLEDVLHPISISKVVLSPTNISKAGQSLSLKLLAILKQRNQNSYLLPQFSAPMPLILVPQAEINQVFKRGFWKAFYQKYQHTAGLASFSLPSYNAEKSTALIYFSFSRGGRDGQGYFYYLVKKSGQWKIKRGLGGWVS